MSIDDPLNQYFPSCGPCLFCGHPDARHRVFDAIISQWGAGDTIPDLAEDYGVPESVIAAVLRMGRP